MLGSRSRRQKSKKKTGNRSRPRSERQRPEVARCFEALNHIHRIAPAPDPEVAAALKLVRKRLIALEKEHDVKAGALAQVERWAARCTAVVSFFLIHPLLAYWNAAGYPFPGPMFWADDNVIAAMGSGFGWILAIVVVARVIIGEIMGWLLLMIVGCLLYVLLFGG